MTAEIGILNRNGVALAADSLGLIKINNKNKFISIEKIYSLSKYHSAGIMVYNFVNFMSTPWETIIKVYVERIGDKAFDTLQEYGEDFIKFLSNDKRFSAPLVEILIIKDVLDYCIYEVSNSVNSTADYEKVITSEIEKRVALLSKEKFLNGFDESFINAFLEKHSKELKDYIKMKPEVNFDVKTQENLIKLCAYVISKNNYISNKYGRTGFVIAGYGDKDIFPSLYAYDIWASIDGRLIYKFLVNTHIGVNNKQSIYSFGETDVVATYIDGINPDLKDKIFDETKYYFNNLLKEIQSKYSENGITYEFSDKEKNIINNIGTLSIKDLEEKVNYFQQKKCVEPFLYMADMLNKKELVNLVEGLVTLTSIKRRFSTDEQTTGGPIDVALITKGDGFVWIKKKEFYKKVNI